MPIVQRKGRWRLLDARNGDLHESTFRWHWQAWLYRRAWFDILEPGEGLRS